MLMWWLGMPIKKYVDFRKCSKLTIFLKDNLNIEADITFDFDGNSILLVSLINGKNIGYINVIKTDENKIKRWLNAN